MISQTLSSIITNLSNAYDMALSMGATIPASRNMENLASTIGTIQAGGDNSLPAFLNDTLSEINDTAGEIKQVKAFAFYGTSITKFNLPSCSIVGSNAFANATNLSSINIVNCSYIQDSAFYSANISSISLPNCIEIGSYAFVASSGQNQITDLSLPKCKYIGSSAFTACSYITSAFIPNVMRINSYTFTNCYKLAYIELQNCSMIEQRGFYNCSSLNYILAPNLLGTYMETFYSCSSLDRIDFPICSELYSSTFVFCTNLNSVNLPLCQRFTRGATSDNTFVYCYNLSYVNAPYNSIVNWSTFCQCNNLISAYMPATTTIGSQGYYRCSKIKEVYDCGTISNQAFNGARSLESLYILRANSVVTLGTNVFTNTPMLASTLLGYYGSIYVPSSLVASYKTATNWTAVADRITDLTASMSSNYIYAYEFQSSTLTEIPSEKIDATYVLHYAFDHCYSLETVSLPNCKYLGYNAFTSCSNLTTVDLPLCEIAINCFSGCSQLSNFNLPSCKYFMLTYTSANISQLNLPECVWVKMTSCSNLLNVSLPKCKYIDYQGFNWCYSLQTAYTPEILYVMSNGFNRCSSLTKLSLPKCIYMGDYTFNQCATLSQLVIGTEQSMVCSIDISTFYNTTFDRSSYLGYYASIYVPDSLVSAYQTAQYWSSLSARITGISNLPSA